MVLDAPLVKAEQHGSIGVEKLTKVGMLRRSRWLAEQRLVPLEAPGHILHPDDRPCAFHRMLRRPNVSRVSCALVSERKAQRRTERTTRQLPRLLGGATEPAPSGPAPHGLTRFPQYDYDAGNIRSS